MKARTSDAAELFIKAEEAPVSLLDQGQSQITLRTPRAVITHIQVCTNGPVLALLICYVDHGHRDRGGSKQTALL